MIGDATKPWLHLLSFLPKYSVLSCSVRNKLIPFKSERSKIIIAVR